MLDLTSHQSLPEAAVFHALDIAPLLQRQCERFSAGCVHTA